MLVFLENFEYQPRDESYIDIPTQCVIMTLAGEKKGKSYRISKFMNCHLFQNSCLCLQPICVGSNRQVIESSL